MTREEREEAIIYFEQCNSNIISVCKDENIYDYEKQDIISDCARKTYEANKLAIEALELVTSYEGTINKLTEALNQQKEGHWITTRTFMHDGEYYCDKCKCESPNNEKWDYCPNCGAKMEREEL